jgi:hypothetical protein
LRRAIAFATVASLASCDPAIVLHRKFLTCIEGGIWPGERRAEVDYVARLALSLCQGPSRPMETTLERFADVGSRDLSVPERQVRWRVQCGKSDVQIVLSCHAVERRGHYCRPERGPEITRLPATDVHIERLAAAVDAASAAACPKVCPSAGDLLSQREVNEDCPNLAYRLRVTGWNAFEVTSCDRTFDFKPRF